MDKKIKEPINQNFKELWFEFSNIQFANDLIKTKETTLRFSEWLKTGNDDDAWS